MQQPSKKYLLFVCALIIVSCTSITYSQGRRIGVISYLTSQTVYLRFETTAGIIKGDTLKNLLLKPVIVVTQTSKKSVAGVFIDSSKFFVGDSIVAFPQEIKADSIVVKIVEKKDSLKDKTDNTPLPKYNAPKVVSKVYGRIGFTSYSSFSNFEGTDFTRMQYTFSFDEKNEFYDGSESECYISYNYRPDKINNPDYSFDKLFRVYSLSVSTNLYDGLRITLGRSISSRVSNVGIHDGAVLNYDTKDWWSGAFVGSRPSYQNLGFDSKYFQYGVFAGFGGKINDGNYEQSIAIAEQTYSGFTDRRFLYLQHSNSIIKNINLFASSEIDLFSKQRGESISNPILTSLYANISWRESESITLGLLYDERRNVVYYESLKNYIDSLIDVTARRGLQMRVQWRIDNTKYLSFSAGTRFGGTSENRASNASIMFSYYDIPLIQSSGLVTLDFIVNQLTKGAIAGIGLNRSFFDGDVSTGVGFRSTQLVIGVDETILSSFALSADCSLRLFDPLFLFVQSEIILEGTATNNSILIGTNFRF